MFCDVVYENSECENGKKKFKKETTSRMRLPEYDEFSNRFSTRRLLHDFLIILC